MKLPWVLSALVIGLVVLANPGRAQAALLYRPDRPTVHQDALAPGRPVIGMPGIRSVTSTSELSTLSWSERRSVQSEVRYHTLFTPNDPQLPLQWNLSYMNVAGAWDADTVAPVYGGDANIVVAVLDTGLASTVVGGPLTVPDFAPASVWRNVNEVAGDGIDNDLDGYVDDVAGWNFISQNGQPVDNNGHGTHIATTIAAQMNNSLATAGIASNVTIMPLKVLDQNGDGLTTTLTAAVNYAVDHGANIINLSLGGDQDDPLFHQAIQQAVGHGVVVIGAAGNSGAGVVTFPSSYAEVISVGAIQVDYTKAPYANYGTRLDLVAPGGNDKVDQNQDGQPDGILSSTCTDGGCQQFASMFLVGTSQAAAQVSAVAALLESCGATPGSIRSILTSTARDLGAPGRDDTFGYGLVDAGAAMAASGCVVQLPTPPTALHATAGAKALTPLVAGRAYPYQRPQVTWSGTAGATFDVSLIRGTTVLATSRQTSTSYRPSITSEGEYQVRIKTVDAFDRTSAAVSYTYRYQKPTIVVSSGSTIRMLSGALKTIRSVTTKLSNGGVRVSGGALVDGQSSRLILTTQTPGSTVTVTNTAGKKLFSFQPFGAKFSGLISTALVRQADGRVQIVAATVTRGANIAWYSSTGKKLGQNSVFAKDLNGVEIAAGDLNGDGDDELVVAQAGGPDLRVYTSRRERLGVLTPRGKTFRQGWSVAVGDSDGDGQAEIFATPRAAVAPRKVLRLTLTGKELGSWKVSGLPTTPVSLYAFDTDGDGRVEVLIVPQQGSAIVQRWSGTGKLLQQVSLASKLKNSLSQL